MISVHTSDSLGVVGEPIPCPSCGKDVSAIGFSLNRHQVLRSDPGSALIPDCPISDVHVPALVYGLSPCGCVAHATWAGNFSAECRRRRKGYPPASLPEIDVDAEIAKLSNYLTRLYAYKSTDRTGNAAVNYWIVVVADEMARLTGTKVSVPPHVLLNDKVREWSIQYTTEKIIYPATKKTLLQEHMAAQTGNTSSVLEMQEIARLRILWMRDTATGKPVWVVTTIVGEGAKVDPVNGVNVYATRYEAVVGAVNRFLPHDGDYLRHFPAWLLEELAELVKTNEPKAYASYMNMQRFFGNTTDDVSVASAKLQINELIAEANKGSILLPFRVFAAFVLGRTPSKLPETVIAVAAPTPLALPTPREAKRKRTIREIHDD